MSAKPQPVAPVVQDNEEHDPVAAAFDNAPFMEATPAMIQAVAEIANADGEAHEKGVSPLSHE